jgi:putative ABC transport system permease protein
LIKPEQRLAFASSVSNAFAAIGLCLALVGLDAVAAYHVTQRTREIGLRMTLGAQPRQVLSLVLRHSGIAVIIGSLAGLAGSFGLAKLLGSLLYGVDGTDWRALAITLAVLIATVLAAPWHPASRAVKIDPACSLREG